MNSIEVWTVLSLIVALTSMSSMHRAKLNFHVEKLNYQRTRAWCSGSSWIFQRQRKVIVVWSAYCFKMEADLKVSMGIWQQGMAISEVQERCVTFDRRCGVWFCCCGSSAPVMYTAVLACTSSLSTRTGRVSWWHDVRLLQGLYSTKCHFFEYVIVCLPAWTACDDLEITSLTQHPRTDPSWPSLLLPAITWSLTYHISILSSLKTSNNR